MNLDYYWKNLKIKSQVYSESVVSLMEEFSPADLMKVYKAREIVAKCRNIAGKSVWSSRSFYKLINAFNPYESVKSDLSLSNRQRAIIKAIINSDIPKNKYALSEVFEAIFLDQKISHLSSSYRSQFWVPEINNIIIVLVDGFLNELYQTPSFTRSLKHLNEKFGYEFHIPTVSGLETSENNQAALFEDLQELSKNNPGKKIWCFSFSKGGIDTLYCALNNKKFFTENVLGISTIASPLRGTQLTDHFLIKKFDSVFKYLQDGKFKQIADELNGSAMDKWYRDNFHNFPKNLFYSSLGFKSPLSQSHIFMRILKILINNKNPNDGVVEEARAHFPHYFDSLNLGTVAAHHLVGLYSSQFDQEALIKAHLILLSILKKI